MSSIRLNTLTRDVFEIQASFIHSIIVIIVDIFVFKETVINKCCIIFCHACYSSIIKAIRKKIVTL